MDEEVREQAATIERYLSTLEEEKRKLHRRYLSLFAAMVLFFLAFTFIIMNDITWEVARNLDCRRTEVVR